MNKTCKVALFLFLLLLLSCGESKRAESSADSVFQDTVSNRAYIEDFFSKKGPALNNPIVFSRHARLYTETNTLSNSSPVSLGTPIAITSNYFSESDGFWFKAKIGSDVGYMRARDVARYSFEGQGGVTYVFGPSADLVKCSKNFEQFLDTLKFYRAGTLYAKKVEGVQLKNVNFVLAYNQMFEMGTGSLTGYIVDVNDSLFVLSEGGGGGEALAGEVVSTTSIFLPLLKDHAVGLFSEIPFDERAYSRDLADMDIPSLVVRSYSSWQFDSLKNEGVSKIDEESIYYRWNGKKLSKFIVTPN